MRNEGTTPRYCEGLKRWIAQVEKWLEECCRFRPKMDVGEVVTKSEKGKIAELEKALAKG